MAESTDFGALPPFTGDSPPCVKCGHRHASTQYFGHGDCIHGPGPNVLIGVQRNERLHRECLRCGYKWDEAVHYPPARLDPSRPGQEHLQRAAFR